MSRAIRTWRWTYAVTAPGVDGRTVSGSETYTESHLYDLEVDPHQLFNLAGSDAHRELCDRLRDRLIGRMVEAGESAPAIEPAPPFRIGQSFLTAAELLL